jgi:hypothetical protein
MRGKRRTYPWQPLTMTWAEVAEVAFRRPETWLRDNFPADFPRPDPTYDLFSTQAVAIWVRHRYGLVSPGGDPHDAEEILIRRANGQGQGPLPDRTPPKKRLGPVLVADSEAPTGRIPPAKA